MKAWRGKRGMQDDEPPQGPGVSCSTASAPGPARRQQLWIDRRDERRREVVWQDSPDVAGGRGEELKEASKIPGLVSRWLVMLFTRTGQAREGRQWGVQKTSPDLTCRCSSTCDGTP